VDLDETNGKYELMDFASHLVDVFNPGNCATADITKAHDLGIKASLEAMVKSVYYPALR